MDFVKTGGKAIEDICLKVELLAANFGPLSGIRATHLKWAALSFVPGALFVLLMRDVMSEFAARPQAWLLPVATVVVAAILAFRGGLEHVHVKLSMAQPAFLALLAYAIGGPRSPDTDDWMIAVAVGFGAALVTTTICLRGLCSSQPAAADRNEFYLSIGAGAVLGGLFTVLLAACSLNAGIAFLLLLAIGMACRPNLVATLKGMKEEEWFEIGVLTLVGLAALIAGSIAFAKGTLPDLPNIRPIVFTAIGVLAVLTHKKPAHQVVFAILLVAAMLALPASKSHVPVEHGLFGAPVAMR